MGNKPSSLDESSLSNIAGSKMDEGIRYKDLVFVKTKPWDTETRNTEFPFEKIQSDDITIESTVIGVDISSPNLTETECAKKDIYPMPYITLESKTEQEIYTLKNKHGQIEVTFEPNIPTRTAIYTVHVRRRDDKAWDHHDVRMKVGEITVSIVTDQFDIDAVFVTSQIEKQTIGVTNVGCVMMLDQDNEDMKIEFPPNAVHNTMTVTIQVTSLDETIKRQKITQFLGEDHGVLGVSDLVNVSHEHPFLVPVRLTLPMPPLQPTPEGDKPTLFVFRVEDGEVKELESATIQEVEPNLFEIQTIHFCRVLCAKGRQNVHSSQAVSAAKGIYDINVLRCNILLLSKIEGKFILLRSEIVSQEERRTKEIERQEMEMTPIRTCTSPTIILKPMDRVRISLANNNGIQFPRNSVPTHPFITYDRLNNDNSFSFYVEKNQSLGAGEFGAIEYDLNTSGNHKRLHTASFHILNEIRKRRVPGRSLSLSTETIDRPSGLQTVVYKQQMSVPQLPSSAGGETVMDGPPIRSRDKDEIPVNVDSLSIQSSQPDANQDNLQNQPKQKSVLLPEKVFKKKSNMTKGEKNHPRTTPNPGNISHKEFEKKEPLSAKKDYKQYAETFSEKSMACLARYIPDNEYHIFATHLDVPMEEADRLQQQYPHPHDRNQLKLRLLLRWLKNASNDPFKRLDVLTNALKEIDHTAVAQSLEEAFNNREPLQKPK
ncbi:LOW QUALITY PROTEIN: uncharacterized protein [Argopecten irradians]|uniref:LOW QUALITY PROTEIN: uncharacterized protein n=1 Tax=Argopecten irradians TaxID=31199 RepID=UPI003710AFDB